MEEKEHFEIVFDFLDRLVKALKSTLGESLISVVLYGSYARGQIEPESDVSA